MPHDVTTPIVRREDLGQGNHLIEFRPERAAEGMGPAQFFMVGMPGSETLLRRPYSVCGLPGTFDGRPADTCQILVKVVGKGTALLAALEPGSPIHVLGPLGRGFTPPASSDVRPVIVAGGIGVAPFPALLADLARRGGAAPRMFYGARTAGDLPLLDWFRERCEVDVTTDDGSLGHRTLVTEPLAGFLAGRAPESVKLYACGPDPMLRAVARIALEHDLDCELSLEAHMACGFGVCLGCVVPTRHPGRDEIVYERVCVEGPVMKPEVLAW